MNIRRREQGQVLVLIILAIVGMLGFAALAVDLGRVFAERRRAQNAADAASLAAAYAGVQQAALGARQAAAVAAAGSQLALNDYDDATINIDNGERVEVQVHVPPISGPYTGDENYYQVFIYQDVEKVFSHFVFGGILDFTVEAVALAEDASGMAEGNAIVATSPDSCGGLIFHGTSDITIQNGGAYSFSDRTGQQASCFGEDTSGGSSCVSGIRDGGPIITLDPGHVVNVHGQWFENSTNGGFYYSDAPSTEVSISTAVNTCEVPDALPLLPRPNCGVARTVPAPSADGIIHLLPGTYADPLDFNGGGPEGQSVRLATGVYCIQDGMKMLKGAINGWDIMFYVEGGNFEMGGTVSANFQGLIDERGAYYPDGPDVDTNPDYDAEYQWGGMLLYMPYDNTGGVNIGAGSYSEYSGTIYAPGPRQTEGQLKCDIGGNSGTIGLNSSIMCYTVRVGGGATIDINYNADMNFHFAPKTSLSQ